MPHDIRPPLPAEIDTEGLAEVQAPESALHPLLSGPLRGPEASGCGTGAGSVVIGRVVAVDEHGPTVRLPGIGLQRARALCALPEDWAERECAVLFENGDPSRPLLLGFVALCEHSLPEHPVSEHGVPENAVPENVSPRPVPAVCPQPAAAHELRVDGERVVIEAQSELELRCGESVILLLRDGRIEIRGNYITSQATATQRLRGGSIHMN